MQVLLGNYARLLFPFPYHLSQPTATAALENLMKLNIVKEISGKKRDRLFAYKAYLDILSQDTEPL